MSSGGVGDSGTVYELTPPVTGTGPWSISILHLFNGEDGCAPEDNLVLDKRGRLYGSTRLCIASVFRLTPPEGSGPWLISILYPLGVTDGLPYPSLSLDAQADVLYGTSFTLPGGYGDVFQLAPPAGGVGPWIPTVLHEFTDGSDGGSPVGPIVWDANGVLYGTDYFGGIGTPFGNGEVFSIAP